MALIAKNDDLGARLELLKAVKYKSDKVEVWKALAGIDERTKANSLFLDLRRIVELDPTDIDARVKLARIMVAGGAAEPAIKILDAANEGDKPNAGLHAVRALALIRMSDPAGAIREAQRAYEIDPADIDAVSLLVSKKLAEGDFAGAIQMLDALPASLRAADRVRIAQLRIEVLKRKGDLAGAEKLSRQLVADYPKEPTHRLLLIQLLTAERKYDDAEKELRARIAASPTDSTVGLDLVRFLNTFKGAEAARAELESRIKAGGDTFDYRFALAELDFVTNRQSDGISSLQKLASEQDNSDRKLKTQVRLAEMLVAAGDQAKAEQLIAEILAKDRRNSGGLRLRAALSLDKGQTDSAIADLREALNDQPKSPELLLALALAYEQAGKPELADRQYADALKNSNLNPEVALRYIAFLQRKNDAARADDVLTEVANRNPGNLQILSSLAQIKLSRQNWPGALAVADTIATMKDGRVVADQIKAAAYAGQQRFAESIVALEDAHKVLPEAIQPAVALASAYIRAERADEAVTLLLDMNKRYPGNAELLVVLGQTKLAQKKDAEAIASFEDAIKQQPKDPSGYSALSDYYIRVKNYDAAEGVLQGALKEIPQNMNLRMTSASLQILKNNSAGAIAQYEAMLKDQPRAASLVAINNLASLLLDTRSDKESLDRASALADSLKTTNVPQFQDTVGWARYKQGDVKSAITVLETAAAKSPNLAAAHYHLGLAYAADGQAQKAKDELGAAAKLEPDGTELKKSIQDALKRQP
ncbi:tetratricopeptide repeat protein [Bradyrhizobium sp. INPA01-394B]|uniref:Tetratricopeptide repeat protein n=1 Tax=Bradyrhizobium campsiandrae TaxID=1729892 RepID=A0ABR7UAJ0_9BRAD|nr:tetratricopeptide repeat protein [Bradyrhizobium campsiandrae]MBC9878313.1 tetratricopeptide repeat protein [Bradyrhizobium campsiandrae]MBC9981025.1 tetratricopeptide repeat protein [Bradyrhizobium campsiandrae]